MKIGRKDWEGGRERGGREAGWAAGGCWSLLQLQTWTGDMHKTPALVLAPRRDPCGLETAQQVTYKLL
jgi:hypothetical protein